jgi:putative ABC transport system ATP-binding protein
LNKDSRLHRQHDGRIAIRVENVHKSYDGGLVPALHGISLELERGRTYALRGPSGCGKSTLLNIIGTLDRPSAGTVEYFGRKLTTEDQCQALRRESIGFVFQFHNLLPMLTLMENVELPLLSDSRISGKERRQRASSLLKAFGLTSKRTYYASRVSGGERQRAAIARALVHKPRLVLADEPTGNVDSGTAGLILAELIGYTKRTGAALLITTHDEQIAALCSTGIRMKDGRIISSDKQRTRADAEASADQDSIRFLKR